MADTHETKIKITGDESQALGAFRKVVSGLNGIKSAAAKVMSAFGVFGLAVNGVQMLVGAFSKLNDMLHASSRQVAQIKWDAYAKGLDKALDSAIAKQGRLNELLKEGLDSLEKQKSVRDLEEGYQKSYQDASRRNNRAVQLAGVTDPNERQALEDQFALEDARRAAAESKAKRKREVGDLEKQQINYEAAGGAAGRDADELQQLMDAQFMRVRKVRDRVAKENGPGLLDTLSGSRDTARSIAFMNAADSPEVQAEMKKLDELKKAYDAKIKDKERYLAEAKSIQSKIDVIESAPDAAGLELQNVQTAISARRNAIAAKQAKEQGDFAASEGAAASAAAFDARIRGTQRAESLATTSADKSDAQARRAALYREKEAAAKAEMEAAREALKVEMAKDVGSRSEDTIADLRKRIAAARGEMTSAGANAYDIETGMAAARMQAGQGFAGRLSAASAVGSGSRLNALGLGSGVNSTRVIEAQAKNVEKIVELVREQISATRESKNSVAVYSA